MELVLRHLYYTHTHTHCTAQHTRTKLLYKYNTITNISVQNVAVQWLVRCEWMKLEIWFSWNGIPLQKRERETETLNENEMIVYRKNRRILFRDRISMDGVTLECEASAGLGQTKEKISATYHEHVNNKVGIEQNYLSYLTGWATWLFGSQIGSIMATFVVRLSFGLISWLNAIQSCVWLTFAHRACCFDEIIGQTNGVTWFDVTRNFFFNIFNSDQRNYDFEMSSKWFLFESILFFLASSSLWLTGGRGWWWLWWCLGLR